MEFSSPQLTSDGTSNVPDYVLLSIARYANEIAQVDCGSNQTLVFSDIVKRVIELEKIFLESGVKKRDTILVISKNTTDYCWVVLGVLAAGAVCAPISPTSTTGEIQHFLNLLRPKIVIAPELTPEQLTALVDDYWVKCIYTDYKDSRSGKISSYYDLLAKSVTDSKETYKPALRFTPTLNDPAFYLSSSGTTGLPKAVVLRHRNIIAALEHSGKIMKYDGVALGLMPFYHAYGLGLMLMALCEGSKMVVMSKFSLTSFLKTLTSHQITHLYIVPSLLTTLAKSEMVKSNNLSSVKEIMTGAGPISLEQQLLLKKKLQPTARIFHSYGMTETTFVVLLGEMREDKPGSMGQLINGLKSKIITDEGELATCGQIGELLIRGPLVFDHYYKNPEGTSESLDKMRWLHTGDLVYMDSDGYYYHVERRKQMIKYQGYQISPTELEMVIIHHDAVKDAAVVGVNHEVFGEIPCAFVVKNDGHDVTEEEIMKLVKAELSPYKQLRGGVNFVNMIPKTTSGKVKRAQLKELYCTNM